MKVNSLADFLFVFAVKVVIQTVRIVAGLITLAVIEDTPAVRVCATSPRVGSQRTVASIPAARECVAFLITKTIIGFAMTVC